MGHGIAIPDRCATDAQPMQRRCFASVPPKGVRLMHAPSAVAGDWCSSAAAGARPMNALRTIGMVTVLAALPFAWPFIRSTVEEARRNLECRPSHEGN